MANGAGLEMQESGRTLKFYTETPHLVSTGSGRLSTTVTLHPLFEGRIILGSSREADIQIGGTGVELVHCIIENVGGSVMLQPLTGTTCVDGVPITAPKRLSQGCILTIGISNYLRFNHPTEARQLKSVLPNPRVSMAAVTFNGCTNMFLPYTSNGIEKKQLEQKAPVIPQNSPRNSGCSDAEVNFLGKLTKFEMLARQANTNCVSPKVFPPGSLTTNVPAEQILGHSRSSSIVSLGRNSTSSPFQNLVNLEKAQSMDEHKQCSLSKIINSNYSPSSNILYQNIGENNKNVVSTGLQQHPHHYQSTFFQGCKQHQPRISLQELNCNNDENRNNVGHKVYPSDLMMSRSLTYQRNCELNQFGREFDMSQSLIVAKTTTCTEFVQVENFNSNPSLPCYRRVDTSDIQNTRCGSHPNMKRIQPPSPAFNRDPKYNEPWSQYGCNEGDRGSPDQLQEHSDQVESHMQLEHQEQLRDQELEHQERMRLDEILTMCAEYERQTNRPIKPQQQNQQNRLKTNGLLSPDKMTDYNNATSFTNRSKSPTPTERLENEYQLRGHELKKKTSPMQRSAPVYENVVDIEKLEMEKIRLLNNNWTPELLKQQQQHNGHFSLYQEYFKTQNRHSTCNSNYEEIDPESYSKDKQINNSGQSTEVVTNDTTTNVMPHEKNTKSTFHHYENFVPLNENVSIYENVNSSYDNNHSNNIINDTSLPTSTKKTRDKREKMTKNKLDVSNKDLLEAIEQLSMLSKPRNFRKFSSTANTTMTTSVVTTMTPTISKRINNECNNVKSNEDKVDKDKKKREVEDRKKYLEFLQNEKQHILGNIDGLKRSVSDIEMQEEEINRELELEAALLSAEYESEALKLEQEENERARVHAKIGDLEDEMTKSNAYQAQLQAKAKQRVVRAQHTCARLEEELADASGRDDQRDSDLVDKLATQTELLETERKAFEDLEFHHLEEEASKLATKEELQRYISELSAKIENRKIQLDQLDSQRNDIKNAVNKETTNLDSQKLAHLRRLEEGRNRLRAIDDELESLAKNVADNPDVKRSPSREDFDRISRVTTDSPIVNNHGSLGRKTIESLKEIERNRQLHLAKQGSQVISEERRRVEELKRRVQNEVRSQWEERKLNCTSFNSVESGEESSSYSTGPTESGSGSSDGADNGTNEKLSPRKLSEYTTPSPGPSSSSYTLLLTDNVRDNRPTSMERERFSRNGNEIADETESRPLSQSSSELDSLGSLQVKHRDKSKLQRPLTRYLPIKSESLDLRHHIETAGHQLPLIHDVTVDTTNCSGCLSKMSKKFHHWNKRWFVFDRKRKTLTYYSDNNSKKPRGVIYFQSIEEVYVDHMNTVKSPQPSITFIVKTSTRLYHLMAPSPEAMRVWIDVIFTGAEGYNEFDPNL